MTKRIISFLLTICMVLAMVPSTAIIAADEDTTLTITGAEEGQTITFYKGEESSPLELSVTNPSEKVTDYTWSADELPNGLELTENALDTTATLTGKPTDNSLEKNIVITVTGAGSDEKTYQGTLNIKVIVVERDAAPQSDLVLQTDISLTINGNADGTPFTFTKGEKIAGLTFAINNPPETVASYIWNMSELPEGLTFTEDTPDKSVSITGTPTAVTPEKEVNISVTGAGTDGNNYSGSLTIKIIVSEATTPSEPDGTPVTTTVTTNAGTGTIEMTNSNFPSGTVLDSKIYSPTKDDVEEAFSAVYPGSSNTQVEGIEEWTRGYEIAIPDVIDGLVAGQTVMCKGEEYICHDVSLVNVNSGYCYSRDDNGWRNTHISLFVKRDRFGQHFKINGVVYQYGLVLMEIDGSESMQYIYYNGKVAGYIRFWTKSAEDRKRGIYEKQLYLYSDMYPDKFSGQMQPIKEVTSNGNTHLVYNVLSTDVTPKYMDLEITDTSGTTVDMSFSANTVPKGTVVGMHLAGDGTRNTAIGSWSGNIAKVTLSKVTCSPFMMMVVSDPVIPIEPIEADLNIQEDIRTISPKTGDNTPLGMLLALLVISGFGIIVLSSKKREY